MALTAPQTSGILPFDTPGAWISTIVLMALLQILIYVPLPFLVPKLRTPVKITTYLVANLILLGALPATTIAERSVNAALIATGNMMAMFTLVARKIRMPGADFTATLVYHRWIGRIILALCLFHGLVFLGSPTRSTPNTRTLITANVSFAALLIITTFSHSIFRRRQFELFYYTHFLYVIFVIAAMLHQKLIAIYVLPAMLLYLLDKAYGYYTSYRNTAVVRHVLILPHRVARIKFASATLKYKPGQHLWVQFSAIDRIWHPYSISSYPGEKHITLHIKGLGNYTEKLVKTLEFRQQESANPRDFPMSIDGPYGGSTVNYSEFSHVLFFAGGIGITPLASHLGSLLESAKLKEIRLVWTFQQEDQYEWFSEELVNLHAKFNGKLIIDAYVTRGRPSGDFFLAGRPKIDSIVKGLVREGGWAVGVCGPTTLVREVQQTCHQHSSTKCKFHVHDETFIL